MRLPFRRRRRFTTPPDAPPLVVIAFVATNVALFAICFFGGAIVVAATLVPGSDSYPVTPVTVVATAAGLALNRRGSPRSA